MSGVLQLYKQARFFYKNQLQHQWVKNRNIRELSESRILIVGAGSIGTEVAKRFQSFGCTVVGVDIVTGENACFDRIVHFSELQNELPKADIVILTLPLTESTSGFFDSEFFSKMKTSAVFVNVARGRLVDESALVAALQNGKIAGAVLDVFEEEPLTENSPLWDMENVILTPHNSFVSDKNNGRLFDVIVSHLRNQYNA